MPWMSYSSTVTSTMTKNPEHAYVTLLMTDDYLPGALVLGHSLKDNGTTKQLVALVTLDSISATTIDELKTVYDQVIPVERLTNSAPGNLYLMGREDLASTFSKIALWKLEQFSRVVYIDADVVALRAPDELFDLQSDFAAAPDVGWPDIFNSGVMALRPNLQDYYALQALARNGVSFDGADQGLLNMHFTRNLWERLSFTYNCTPSGNYQYAPAYRHFGSQISLVHFIGRQKPWQAGRHSRGFGSVYQELSARWWSVYDQHYRGSNNTVASGQAPYQRRTVQKYVMGEANTYDIEPQSQPQSQSQTQTSAHNPGQQQPQRREIPRTIVTPPPEDSAPIVEQRRWSAPHVQWDPARAPPPEKSEPEAANFPSNIYTMSDDTKLFQPPQSYPEPPRDMWYEVPKERAVYERPKAIFPWEANQTRAKRVFPDEAPLPPVPNPDHQPAPMPTLDTASRTEVSDTEGKADAAPDVVPASIASGGITSEAYSSYSRSNAWDEIPGINKYMEAFQSWRRGKHSPASSISGAVQRSGDAERRPSLLLTDFPTEVDRPSLPVTPALRRNTFWGNEQSDADDLPPAEGVPSQETWDPLNKLEELQRRQSETFLAGPSTTKSLPSREQISSTVPSTVQEETEPPRVSEVSSSVSTTIKDPPVFGAVDFESKGTVEDEGLISPVATAEA